nr:hypothetical protein [Tanacetum cinerariifolium]
MSRDVLTVDSTMRIPLLYRGEYSQWSERFMKYLEEQMDGEAMINSIKNGDQPLPRVTQVSIARTSSTEQPPLKDKSMLSDQERKIQNIDRLARSLLIQGLSNISILLLTTTKPPKTYGMLLQGKCLVLNIVNKIGNLLFCLKWKQYETMMRHNKNLMDINIDTIYKILNKNQRDVNDAIGLKKKTVVVTSDPLALIAEKTKVSKRKEKVVVSSDSEGSDEDDSSELKKISALLAKAFNQKKFYSKPTNNNLRTSSASNSANRKQEFVKSYDKKEDNKKAKVKDYEYYKTKMLLAKKDKDEQVLLDEDYTRMESSSDSDQEINSNMVFMAQIEKILSDSEASSSSFDDKIAEDKMDDPNITMEEYIRLEEEKARRRAIVFNDTFASEATPSCEPTVSSINNDEIDFRISFDESNDEDCMVINDLFPFNVIYPNDSKSDKENDDDNDKVDIEHSSRDMSVIPLSNIADTAYSNPMDMAYSLSGRYPILIFSTVYTTYSLNEYDVYREWIELHLFSKNLHKTS